MAQSNSGSGSWQLYSTSIHRVLAVYGDFDACRQAANLGRDLACRPVEAATNTTPTPPVMQPLAVKPPVMNGAFRIDASNLPDGDAGSGYDRVRPTAEVAPPSDIGAFRVPCSFSHMAFDDPIVYPGVPGAAHLHTFFGNTATSATSTADSIRTSGNSTCLGGTINRSAYWVPSMIDTSTGKPIVPDVAGIYYKQGYTLEPPTIIQPLPAGLRMIAGDPTNDKPGSPVALFKCIGGPNNSNDQYGSSIPNCDAGAQVYQVIVFPQCWDGKNLDSPDHKSHMSYVVAAPGGSGFTCPATHPVALPEITFNIIYTVQTANAAKAWRLSSDAYDTSLPAGYSSHGDWFNGWEKPISDAWAAGCVQARRDCHAHLLGDGRMMY
ncbi:MAG TPA: DUF1996 domain-containing protein [Caldimonas sp.]|nr:DUF1996 domain-containing protein [Caldimonas sp.]